MNFDHKQWIELANMTMQSGPVSAEAVFVHGWGDLHDELMEYSADLFFQGKAKYIILNGEEHYDGEVEPGYPYWVEQLNSKYQIPKDNIKSFLPGKHTLHEAEGFMQFAKQEGISSSAIVSVPQHIFRAFLTDLEAMKSHKLALKLYPRTIPGINWEEKILIEGIVPGVPAEHTTRLGRLVGECARIGEYREKFEQGNLDYKIATIAEGLEFLQQQ